MPPQSSSSSKKRKDLSEAAQAAGPSAAPLSRTQSRSRQAAKEARRARGEIACAECRRLKIKCDRQVPCSTCVSRGCAVLCPNDVLPPGDNSRHLNSATDHLKKKMTKMEERIRALEDALAIAQAQESDKPHTLLSTPWKVDDDEEEQPHEPTNPGLEDLVDTLGTLHIDEKGKTVQFFGPSGGTESVLLDNGGNSGNPAPSAKEDITSADLRALGIPEEADLFYFAFPFTPIGVPREPARVALDSALPPYDRALSLCKVVPENMSWMFQIVSSRYLTTELIPSIYGSMSGKKLDYGAHDLALLLITMAIGALVDVNQPPYNAEALRYYIMARSAAGLEPIMERGSLATVRFLHLLSIYNGLCGKESSLPNTYALLNIAGIMAQRIGLHVDPAHWGLDEKTCYERRAAFWNLCEGDTWQSLGTGRPPCMGNCIDTAPEIPSEEEEAKYTQGEVPLGFGRWGHCQLKELNAPLVRFVNAAKPPSYERVLELDKEFRSAALPAIEYTETSQISVSMRWYVRSHYIELILITLHKGFFAQAISTHPENPLQSPYAHSFITAYHCAVHFLRTTRVQFQRLPDLMTRIWQIWTFTLTSCLIVGSVALHSRSLALEPSPVLMFEEACMLLEDAGKVNSRAAKGLPVLLAMREKIRQMFPSNDTLQVPIVTKEDPSVRDETERVAIFGGKTRLVASSAIRQAARQAGPTGHIRLPTHTPSPPHSHGITPPPPGPSPEHAQHRWTGQSTQAPSYPGYAMVEQTLGHQTSYPTFEQPRDSTQGASWPISQIAQPFTEPYHYAAGNNDGVDSTDFILNDTWTAFLQGHGVLPKIS